MCGYREMKIYVYREEEEEEENKEEEEERFSIDIFRLSEPVSANNTGKTAHIKRRIQFSGPGLLKLAT
jgi:hypothetical protein